MIKFSDYIWPARKGLKPFEHQIETTKFLLANKRAYVLNEMGTGKTMSALWASDFLLINDKINRILIIGPLSTLNSVWGSEIFINFPHRRFKVAHGSKSYRTTCLNSNADFVVINHDGVVSMESEILKAKFDLIIIDELTAYKTATTKRSRSIQRICYHAKAVWGMTGNPTANGPLDAFGQCKVINPTNPFLPKFYTQFRDLVCYQVDTFTWKPKIDSEKMIYKIMQPSIRFRRDECIDLPDMMFETLEIDLSKQQDAAYTQMKKEMYIEYETGQITAQTAATRLIKLLQISSGSVKDDVGNIIEYDITDRVKLVEEIFEETSQRKLIIFCMFRATCERLERILSDKHKVGMIYGSVDQKTRAKIISEFQENDLEIIVAQIASISHGVTLTAASTIIYWDLTPSLEQYEQACSRIRRIGQKFKQLIIHFVSSSADKHILKIIERKEKFSVKVLDLFKQIVTE